MDNPNITMEEYIRIEEEKEQSRGETFNWQNARFRIMEHYYEEECFTNIEAEFSAIEDSEIEFPAIVLNDTSTFDTTFSYEPTVSLPSKDEIDFRILFDESEDEEYTEFENEFPAIAFNDNLTPKLELLVEPSISPP
ncbi:hypothetical protein Tco_1501607 [Tanacetum coccineum]